MKPCVKQDESSQSSPTGSITTICPGFQTTPKPLPDLQVVLVVFPVIMFCCFNFYLAFKLFGGWPHIFMLSENHSTANRSIVTEISLIFAASILIFLLNSFLSLGPHLQHTPDKNPDWVLDLAILGPIFQRRLNRFPVYRMFPQHCVISYQILIYNLPENW